MCCPCPSGYMEKIEMSSKYTNTKNVNNPWQHYLLGLNNCCSICWSKRDQQIIIVPKISFTFIHFLNVHQVISSPKIKLRKNLSTPPQVEKLNWLVVKGICFIGLCCLVSSSPCINGKFYNFSLKKSMSGLYWENYPIIFTDAAKSPICLTLSVSLVSLRCRESVCVSLESKLFTQPGINT